MHNTMFWAALDLAEEDSSHDEDESGSESDADGESASQSGSESAASQSSAATQRPVASLRAGQRNCDATGVAYPLLHTMEMKHGDNLHTMHSRYTVTSRNGKKHGKKVRLHSKCFTLFEKLCKHL